MQTPTKRPGYRYRVSSDNSTALRPSVMNNQRAVSERTASNKFSYTGDIGENHYHSLNNSPSTQILSRGNNSNSNNLTRTASRTTSRNTSRNTSISYLQQPPTFSGSTPYGKSISRSTSRSSSRLSLSSVASTSASCSRIPSATVYSESLLSLGETIRPNNSRIQVSVRPRPLGLDGEQSDTYTPWFLDLGNSQVTHSDLGCFQYDHVFSTDDSNEHVFQVVACPVIEKCLAGYNGTVFAYGMTGSGKTYSMRGVLQNTISMLFQNIHNESDNHKSPKSDRMEQDQKAWEDDDVFQDTTLLADTGDRHRVKYITCSILEIYNEKLKDLLNVETPGSRNHSYRSSNLNHDLKIVDDSRYGIQVRGLKQVKVTSSDELAGLIDQGESLRCIDSTDYNYTSSRSHFIVMLKVFMVDSSGGEIVSVLNFCDLAGSERATSHVDRRKEGGYINKSLLALGTVITKLSESQGNPNSHIPFRDSKLTRLLQPSLNGGSAVSILCTIQLGSNVVGETTNTLRFGCRAKNVMLAVKKNPGEVDLGKLVEENSALKLQVEELRSILSSSSIGGRVDGSNNNGSGSSYDNSLDTEYRYNKAGQSDIIKDDLYYEIVAENNILNEQVEHLKRLQLEDNIIRAQECDEGISGLKNLLNGLILDGETRNKSDVILTRLEHKLREYGNRFNEIESYVGHLENRIRVSEIDLARHRHGGTGGVLNTVATMADSAMKSSTTLQDELVEELREEIEDLKATMQRKDAMIRALQRVR